MPLFLPYKRAGTHERIVQGVLWPVTALFGVLVLVPVLLGLAQSFSDTSDAVVQRPWPDLPSLLGGRRQYLRYLAIRYDYWPSMTGYNDWYGPDATDGTTVLGQPELPALEGAWQTRARDALDCLRERLPWTHVRLLYTGWYYWGASRIHALSSYTGLSEEAWKRDLRGAYGTIGAVNARFSTEFSNFAYVKVPGLPDPNTRGAYPPGDPWVAAYAEFLGTRSPPEWRLILSGDAYYRRWLREQPAIGQDVARLAAVTGVAYRAWSEVRLSEAPPQAAGERRLWEQYVRTALSPFFVELAVTPALTERFHKFLVQRHGTEAGVSAAYGAASAAVPLPATAAGLPPSATAFADWEAFLPALPSGAARVRSAETIWHRYLAEKYKSADELNAAHGTRYAWIAEAPWPQPELDRLDWETHRPRYVVEMIFQNYRRAWELMTEASPALLNTMRFAALFTLFAVLVNTGAGYALSRFSLGRLQLFLVLFLALGAFPLEAIAVPNFLLLRGYGLLNTVWALALPTAVNGYYIYLMKGFFDAVPRAYLETATMEGAGEWDLFARVSLPLARPMIAVVALYSFLWSYANFMWAFIVCQQRTQWTLPVLLYSMSTWAAAPVLAAGAVAALLPPLLVFALAHRTLQRGLSLPRV